MKEELDEFKDQLGLLRQELRNYQEASKRSHKPIATIKREISQAEKLFNLLEDIESEHSEAEQEQALLTATLPLMVALAGADKGVKSADKKYRDALKSAGLKDEELDELLELDEEELNSSLKEYQAEVVALTAQLKTYKDLPEAAKLAEKISSLEEKVAELTRELSFVVNRIALSEERLTRINEAQEGVTANLNNLDALSQKYGALMQLSTLANGFNPDALSLTNFVLQERLEMILERASLHLLKISNGKFEFKLNEEKSAQQKKTAGLGITVIDHANGRERPAESLSGGETFYASLSLCLGLAEVVKMDKGGIELGTLFIDEGFGSLSNDKLVEVLDVLDKLRENGRIIGIITHLEDMKSQIPLRLEVYRTEEGPSRTRMAVGGMN
jgi:exonuclease SbcC